MTENPFVSIECKLVRLERLLLEMRDDLTAAPAPAADDFLSLKEAAEFLSVAPQTIYQNIKRIPHHKRFGKLYFKRSELVAYLEQGATAQRTAANKKGGKL